MEPEELTGYYTYRSFLNQQNPVDDFNQIKFAEAEVFLLFSRDQTIGGTLSFPAAPAAQTKDFMDLSGRVLGWSPLRVHFTGRGRANTAIFDYLYDYEGEVAPYLPQGKDQRLALCGTVVRSQDHGTGNGIAKGGATASFVAVKRDLTEARDTPGFGLIQPAKEMLASRLHRLHHTAWHTLRGVWWDPLNDADRAAIGQLNWAIARAPFDKNNVLDVGNGAGEDFLFMHRRMIAMVHDIYQNAGAPPPQAGRPCRVRTHLNSFLLKPMTRKLRARRLTSMSPPPRVSWSLPPPPTIWTSSAMRSVQLCVPQDARVLLGSHAATGPAHPPAELPRDSSPRRTRQHH